MFEEAQYPLLQATYDMSNYLRSMDNNFATIAISLTGGTSGVDITGSNFQAISEESFAGFSSKTVELLSSGLWIPLQRFGDMIDANTIDVQSYLSTYTESSSLWGASQSWSIDVDFDQLDEDAKVIEWNRWKSAPVFIFSSVFLLGLVLLYFGFDTILNIIIIHIYSQVRYLAHCLQI